MERRIKYLKITLYIEMVLGTGMGAVMALFLGTMATDSPTSTTADFVMGALMGFSLFAIPLVFLPILSLRELNRFAEKRVSLINYINSAILILFVFFPLGIWQIYNLVKLKSAD
ncbi:hypothetical protein [Neptuniibacter sp. 2_MG-2023]|uniref:hypothetical protein n=1 Tax=Neptuniibacter sp. 2_MG-2023 TaxID=3062671 RepID=UPI0026E34C3C|nr:hypothetical protein [Neptuniibacter sp. 2_MG-2023]MDO6514603.1 hypothetical protein [Neptuniibacter sp. 2_MG-2023]